MKGTLLKILSVIAFSAVMFPFMICADSNAYGNVSALRLLYYYGAGALMLVLGYLGSELAKARKKLRIPVRIAGILTFGAGFLSLIIGDNGFMVFALGALCVFMFFIGERSGYRNFASMYPLSAFAAYIVFALACYIFAAVSASENGLTAIPDIILTAFAIEFAMAALLVNQSGIYDRANMRKETKTSLPKGLSAYNAALVLGFTVTGLLLCIFRKEIAWLLRQAALTLLKAIFALFSMFGAERMAIDAGGSGDPAFGGYTTSPIAYIIEAVGIITLLVLIIVFRKKIFSAIKAFFAKLGSLLSGRPESTDRPEFTDVFENYTSGSREKHKTDSIYTIKRRYISENDPGKKYRLGYRLLLFRIKAVNQRLSPSDTTSVQAKKGYERFGKTEMDSTVSVYNMVRYCEETPDSAQLDALNDLVEKQ